MILQFHCIDYWSIFTEKINENADIFIPVFAGLFLLCLFPTVISALEKNRGKPFDFQ